MFATLVTLQANPGDCAALEALYADYCAYVEANEPATLVYRFGKSRTEPHGYRVIEIYDDEAGFEAHKATERFPAFRAALVPLLAEPPAGHRLDVLA